MNLVCENEFVEYVIYKSINELVYSITKCKLVE